MNKDKIIKISIISLITLLILSILGLSYAYFSLLIKGESKNMITKMGYLRLRYVDNDVIALKDVFPGDSVTKTVTVTNIGTLDAYYNLVWEELTNNFVNDELVIEGTCTRLNNENVEDGTCEDVSSIPVASGKIKPNIMIEPNITHKYVIKITFIDTGKSQNYNKNADFNGKIGLSEGANTTPVYCFYDGDVVTGSTFTKGDYYYKYNQELNYRESPVYSNFIDKIPASFMSINSDDYVKVGLNQYGNYYWADTELNGWSVVSNSSLDSIDGAICTYINNKPVVSMKYAFADSKATSINLKNINTSNITNMHGMFEGSAATSLDLSGFDTSNVTDMGDMFNESKAFSIDLSSFNTSNVTNMNSMFYQSTVKNLDLSNFNTSNVTDMRGMFYKTNMESLNIKNFNVLNADINSMFYGISVPTLDLSSFDTSNVTEMYNMFAYSNIDSLNLSNFNTSNVTGMEFMFYGSTIGSLDLSSFDTSKVIAMGHMFNGAVIDTLNLSSFDTSNVTNMRSMFANSKVSVIDLSSFDTSNVIEMTSMFNNCSNLKTIYASDKFVTNNVKYYSSMFTDSPNLVGGAGTKYSSSRTSYTYARIDGGTSKPGYFTLKTT